MPTKKPGVMTYLESGLYEKLLELKERRGARSLSQTVEEILKEYFGGTISSTLSNTLFLEQQRQLVRQITDLSEKYQTLQEAIADLQSIVLAVANATRPDSAPINLLTQKFTARQVSKKLAQQKRKDSLIQDKCSLGKLTQPQNSDNLALEKIKKGLTGTELANRLNVNSSTLSRRRSRSDFSNWSQLLDPDKIAWSYNYFTKAFYPAEIAIQETTDSSPA